MHSPSLLSATGASRLLTWYNVGTLYSINTGMSNRFASPHLPQHRHQVWDRHVRACSRLYFHMDQNLIEKYRQSEHITCGSAIVQHSCIWMRQQKAVSRLRVTPLTANVHPKLQQNSAHFPASAIQHLLQFHHRIQTRSIPVEVFPTSECPNLLYCLHGTPASSSNLSIPENYNILMK